LTDGRHVVYCKWWIIGNAFLWWILQKRYRWWWRWWW